MNDSKTMTLDLTPEGLKTQEGIRRSQEAQQKWEGFHATVANGAASLLKQYDYLIEAGIRAEIRKGNLNAEDAQEVRDSVQTLKADIEEMQIAQENFLRSMRANWTEYNPTRREKRPE